MSKIKWERLSALNGMHVVYNAMVDGEQIAQVTIDDSGTIKKYIVFYDAGFATLREAKAEVERCCFGIDFGKGGAA